MINLDSLDKGSLAVIELRDQQRAKSVKVTYIVLGIPTKLRFERRDRELDTSSPCKAVDCMSSFPSVLPAPIVHSTSDSSPRGDQPIRRATI